MLWTKQQLLAQGLEFPASGPCAQTMSQWAPCAVSTGERGVGMCGNSSGLEVKIASGSSHSHHPLRHRRPCLRSGNGQEGFGVWWYPQAQVSSLTCRSVRALHPKIRPFLQKVYWWKKLLLPSSPVSLPPAHHLTCILSPPWHQPNHFYSSCWHQEGNSFSSSIWWLLETKGRFCSLIPPYFLFLRKIWVVCTSYRVNAIKRLQG